MWLVELRGFEPLTSAVRLPQKVQKKAARILGQKKRRLDMLAIHPVTRDKRRSDTANFCSRAPFVGALTCEAVNNPDGSARLQVCRYIR
jgi:hypothetical protein